MRFVRDPEPEGYRPLPVPVTLPEVTTVAAVPLLVELLLLRLLELLSIAAWSVSLTPPPNTKKKWKVKLPVIKSSIVKLWRPLGRTGEANITNEDGMEESEPFKAVVVTGIPESTVKRT